MADYTCTPGSVAPSAAATLQPGTFGAAGMTAGMIVYQDTGDLDAQGLGKWKPAKANGAGLINAAAGVLVNSGGLGQPCVVCTADPAFTHGLATVAAGAVICSSNAVAGNSAPVADAASGDFVTVVQIAISATQSVLGVLHGTAAHA